MLIPDVMIDIKFYATAQGGRKMPTPPKNFGCLCDIDNEKHDCRLLLDNIGSINPGDFKSDVPIKFLCFENVLPKLYEGKNFTYGKWVI